jgi:hypothetical protein
MTREEINQVLISLGWVRYRDEVGDSVLTKRTEKGVVWFVTRNNTFGIDLNPVISTDVFDKFDHIIGANDVDHYTGKITRRRYAEGSVICQSQCRLHKEDYTEEDVVLMSNQILEWAASVDIEAGLADLRALPTDCLGAMPVRHLAALAVAGDVETLGRYRDSFAAGDRLDFVPYIDEGYIARALELAEKRKADPNWIPDKPKMRV